MRHRTHPSSGRTAGRASRYIRRKIARQWNRVRWIECAVAYALVLVGPWVLS